MQRLTILCFTLALVAALLSLEGLVWSAAGATQLAFLGFLMMGVATMITTAIKAPN